MSKTVRDELDSTPKTSEGYKKKELALEIGIRKKEGDKRRTETMRVNEKIKKAEKQV